ncbi:MAG: lamin tail domain-containing protein [Leptospiraceae bacterium]|nr:lamin tail domain-containing protein [Leptospiraceae bacterium]
MIHLFRKVSFVTIILISISCTNSKGKNILPANLLDGWSNQFLSEFSGSGKLNRGNEMETLLKQVIDSSTTTLYCAIEDVNIPGVLNSIWLAHTRNVDVKIALDEDNRDNIGYRYLAAFLPTIGEKRRLWIGNKGEGNVYFNTCVSDKSRAFFSSTSPTTIGFYYKTSYYGYVQSNEDGIVRKFSSALDLFNNGAFGSSRQKLDQRNHWILNGIDVGIYFSPEEKPMNFIQKRIVGAKESIQVFSSEFFGNKLDGDSSVRIIEDLAKELTLSKVRKEVVGTTFAQTTIDPEALGDCAMNDFIGLTNCDRSKSTGSSGTSPRGLNSLNYLRLNGIDSSFFATEFPGNSLNLFLIDSNSREPKAFILSSPFSKRSDSTHDGTVFFFENRAMTDKATSFFQTLSSNSKLINSITKKASFLDVVISEINWMGSYNKSGKKDEYEYIELYNNTNSPIHLEGYKIECGANGVFTTVYTLPKSTVIGEKSYLLISDDGNTTLSKVHSFRDYSGSKRISDSNTDQCRIMDTSSTVIDIAGVSGELFNLNSTKYGYWDIDNKSIRTMERNVLSARGDDKNNWHTNSNRDYLANVNFTSDYIDRTYGTPGVANSPNVAFPELARSIARKLVINEIGIDSPITNDRWVEIYNPTDTSIDLGVSRVYLSRDSSCSLTGSSHTGSVALTGTIAAKGYYIVSRNDSPTYASSANLATTELSSLSTNCIFLTIEDNPIEGTSFPTLIDFVNIGGVGSLENSSFLNFSSGAFSRCANGSDTNVNANDFISRPRTPGLANRCDVPTSVLITEWSDGATNMDYIELKNFGTSSVILDESIIIEYGVTFSQSEPLFQYAGDGSNTLGTIPSGGVSIASSESVIVCESDAVLANLRAANGFTGKIFALNRTSLMTTGSSQLLRQNPARLKSGATTWSLTPNLSTFTLSTQYLRSGFNFSTNTTSDSNQWGDTATPTIGTSNPP